MNYSKWKILERSYEMPTALLEEGYQPLLAAMLHIRGIGTAEEARQFLHGGAESLIDPMLMKDMDKAVQRIKAAFAAGETVAVYGDYDVDGITATCLLTDWLRGRGMDCYPYIPDRIEEGYGLNSAAIDSLKNKGVSLIISVDCGITAVDEAKHAREIGVDLIITDHHECHEQTLPEAVAVKAVPACNITFIEGDEMQQKLSGYLAVLLEQNPKAVGGALPGDDFYYKR